MLRKRLFLVCILLASLGVHGQNADVINYINTWKDLAIKEMQRTGVPASITLAQGIHESMAGKSPLARKSNNHFGIKCKSNWQGDKVYHDDDKRGECFRSYPSAEQSYIDHSDFLRNSSRYAFLFNLPPTDYKEWAHGLKKAGYATNVRYAQILIKLIEDYNLNQYTLIALGELPSQDEILAGNSGEVVQFVSITESEPDHLEPADESDRYPSGEFTINNTKVIYAKAGTSLLVLANQYKLSLGRLLDFNDLKQEDVLIYGQLIFLQRKRKTGATPYHQVLPGETLYHIAQREGIRLESLLELNHLKENQQPAPGEKLYLQAKAPARPRLVSESRADLAVNEKGITHVVGDNETLFSIARKYGTTVAKIREWNKLTDGDLRKGQELVIFKN